MEVEFFKHNIGEKEKEKILQCLDGIFLTTGVIVSEFETKFSYYLDLPFSVGLKSGTGALHLSLLALGIGTGDEVITTPQTFIATANAVLYTGAKPVFVDVEKSTGLIDPKEIEKAVTERTKAILPVHLYGQMCDMKAIKKIADKYNLKIVEDAAHCIEGERGGIRPGHLGDIACFSFYATKNITSGEGGAIATKHADLADAVRLLRTHGMSKEAADRYQGHYQHWDMIDLGWKYNMDNIGASLLLNQLEDIDVYWQKRDAIARKYENAFKDNPSIELLTIKKDSKSARHLFTILVDKDKRDEILGQLNERGIGVAVNYRAIHLLTYFQKKYGLPRRTFPNAEDIGDRTISLPLYPKLTNEESDYVIEAISQITAKKVSL